MASNFREVIVMTKSSKWKGYCVAGIDIISGEWVRLNSSSSGGELSSAILRYKDGSCVEVLDQVRVPIMKRAPLPTQPENLLIDAGTWIKTRRCTLEEALLVHPVENRRLIFGNLDYSVHQDNIRSIDHSLEMIQVENLTIFQTKNYEDKPKTKISFDYNARKYEHYSVTDSQYYSVQTGSFIKFAILVISLPVQPFNDYYFKFVSQIFNVRSTRF